MNNDLKILISGLLDKERSERDINKQLARMSHKLNKLKLDIQIDDKFLRTMDEFSKQMKRIQGDALQFGKRIEEVTLPDKTKVKTTRFDNLERSLEDLTVHAEKAKNVSEQVADKNKEINQEMTKRLKLNRESITETKKGLSLLKQELSDNQNIHKVTVERDKTGKIISARYATDHQKAQQLTHEEKRQTEELKRQLDIEKRKVQIRASELVRQYPSIDRSRINNVLSESNSMTTQGNDIANVKNRYRELNLQLKEVETQTKKVTANTNTMVGAFQNAMVKFCRLRW